MRPQLRALAAQQGGLVTRRQAIEAGHTERELRTLTAVHGPWVVVRRGVYAERELWDSLTGYDDHARLRDLAAHLSMTTDHLMSHDSAARALGIPMLRPAHELSHITRRRSRWQPHRARCEAPPDPDADCSARARWTACR